MTTAYLMTWLMVFVRTMGVLMQLPLIANRPIPNSARVGLCLCVATLIAGSVGEAAVPATLWALAFAVMGEAVMGLALGFVSRLVFAAVEMGGRLMATEIGLSASPGMGVPEPATEPLAALVTTFAIIMFFLFGGHLMMITALTRSFAFAPAGQPHFVPEADLIVIEATAKVIELGLRLAAPFIAMNFLITLAFSVLGRVVPKMNVFIVSLSAKVVAGLTLLASSGALLARYLYIEFGDVPLRMLHLVGK